MGPVAQASLDAHARLIEATQAGFAAARPGASAADLFHAMDQVLTGGAGGSDAGRYGLDNDRPRHVSEADGCETQADPAAL